MKNIKTQLKAFLLVLLLLPSGVFAKEMIGDYLLEYDQKIEADTDGNGKNDRTSYYLGERLVWSSYDEDENGEPDFWLRYKNGDTVDLEIYDPDGDGEPEKIAEFDYQGKREVIYDSEAEFAGNSPLSYVVYIYIGVGLAIAVFFVKRYLLRKFSDK